MKAAPGPFTRLRAAIAKAIMPAQQRSAFAAANTTRLTADWILAGLRSADQDARYDLRKLRDRSRELVRNSAYMARFHQLVAENVVGPDGFTLQSKALTLKGDPHDMANAAIEAAWVEWSRPENCDATGMLSLTEMLNLAVSGLVTDGEILIRKVRGAQKNGWNFSLQLLDPDFIDENWNREPLGTVSGPQVAGAGGLNAIRNGVEIDDIGRPVALWMWTRHPAEFPLDRRRIRVAIDDVYHVFLPTRVNQHRGLPAAAPVMLSLKMLDGFSEAHLVASRVSSAVPWTIEIPDPEKAPGIDPNAGAQDVELDVEPGTGLKLNPGEHLNAPNPNFPAAGFESFVRAMLHQIAAGLSISYNSLTGDLSQANYSSMRAGMLPERDHWKRMQRFLAVHLLDRVYRDWLPQAMLAGKLPGSLGYDPTRFFDVRWQPRGFDWVDPKKDLEGDLLEVNAGVQSLTRIAAKKGRDLAEIIAERKAELDAFASAGVPSVLATAITESPKTELPSNADDPGAPDAVPQSGSGRVLRIANG